jgi:hypothetical protein
MSNLGGGLRAVDWSSVKIERFEKNFYAEDKRVSVRSEREIEEFRRLQEIKVRQIFTIPHSLPLPLSLRSRAVACPGQSLFSTRQAFQST